MMLALLRGDGEVGLAQILKGDIFRTTVFVPAYSSWVAEKAPRSEQFLQEIHGE